MSDIADPAHPRPDAFDDMTALLWLVAAGDTAAFQRLYDREAPRLYAVALRLCDASDPAIEAVHAALLMVWRGVARFDPLAGNPQVWLINLVRDRALEQQRRRSRDGLGLDPAHRALDIEAHLSALSRHPHPDIAQMHQALGGVDRDGQALLLLAYLDGLSAPDLARRQRLPTGTIKAWTRRSLERLRRGWEQPA
jgi:RNA polymerase sigma-70 factor (ECF subfamily)